MKLNIRQPHEKAKPTLILLNTVDRDIVDTYMQESGVTSKSAAIRMILRDWQRRHQRKASTQRNTEPA